MRLLIALAFIGLSGCTGRPAPALPSTAPECQWAASRNNEGSLEMLQLREQCGLSDTVSK